MQAAGIAERLKGRSIGFAISDAALDTIVKVNSPITQQTCGMCEGLYAHAFAPQHISRVCLLASWRCFLCLICCMNLLHGLLTSMTQVSCSTN